VTVDLPRTEWDRACDAIRDAQLLVSNGGFDSAASRACYAIFHALTALFPLEGRTFTKHSALEAAVHRDLVKVGPWSADLGRDFSSGSHRQGGDFGEISACEASLHPLVRELRFTRSILQEIGGQAPSAVAGNCSVAR
jgi:uncharacterized protein (UPF0332 family)